MKIRQNLFLVFMVMISLCIITAASAADNVTDAVEITDDADEVQVIDNVDEENIAVENDVVLEENVETADEPILSAANSDDEPVLTAANGDDEPALGESSFSFGKGGNGSSFNISDIKFDFGNGTSIDLGSLLNGTSISFGNGTSFNISSLLNSNMTFGNGTSFNLTQILNMTGNGTGSFNISSILDMIGGKSSKITFEAKDIKQTYSGPITFKVTVLDGDKPVAQQTVIFTVDNKDYVGRTDENGTATISLNLAAGTHYIYTEYNNVLGKNKIDISKAASKLTAKKKTFKAKTKVKKYAITLKNNKGKAIKNAKVTLKVKGKTYTAKTNSKGKATFKIKKLTKKGKYTAKVKFAGNGYYKASSASKKIVIK
ncbi:MAG: Ig-like domain repeat protein [Methanobrevibacter thaueri]|uniref:Ig-like domain repeat protein n=1 Tax=Methanobrevibacter thaueri TaxID=190975 RepID=A0A8T3VFP0_9EURY|nr:Ig-like domain-containing protein [Methanobrevibacter thaueri]MBE6502084.1 Ig-like domain repeat protein [Methanobrevibacter thaueri]